MLTDICQRFTERRESRRPAGELIKTSAYDVEPIDAATAKAFVEKHHYAGTCSSTAHPFALYQRGELAGVSVFGPPPSMNAHRKVFPTLDTDEAVTLGRFVLVDSVPGNGESYFIARCFDQLAARGIVGVESCSDPEPRQGLDGTLVHRGHIGTIYQATNGVYVGKTNHATLRLLPDGTVFNNRASGKACRGEQGRAYAVAQLVKWGATPPADGEPLKAWIRYWRPRITRKFRHRGNHRYVWSLDAKRAHEFISKYGPTRQYPKFGGV